MIANYINNKVTLLGADTIALRLVKWAEQRPVDFVIDCDNIHGLVESARDYYNYETEQGSAPVKGCYCHIINPDVSLKSFLPDFLAISGDVCFSDICCNNSFLSLRPSVYGVVMLGTPRKSFDYDCWSVADSKGLRYATKRDYEGNVQRSEHWLAPTKNNLVGLVYNDHTEKEVKSLCRVMGITAFDINWI